MGWRGDYAERGCMTVESVYLRMYAARKTQQDDETSCLYTIHGQRIMTCCPLTWQIHVLYLCSSRSGYDPTHSQISFQHLESVGLTFYRRLQLCYQKISSVLPFYPPLGQISVRRVPTAYMYGDRLPRRLLFLGCCG